MVNDAKSHVGLAEAHGIGKKRTMGWLVDHLD
jgi:hypothetical protein